MSVELLSPAGSFDALKAAVYAGADAIYLGGSKFNARAYASNFSLDEIKEAVAFCHLHDVKVHVTINILYKDTEHNELFAYLSDLYELGVDAFIVQDEGVMQFITTHFKDIDVHASTQCTIHHPLGLAHYQALGVQRVVVARENTLDDIREMVSSGLEVEAFIHGALCVSYSGQCHMSHMIGDRSANRGTCAQPCRLPYEIYQNNSKIDADPYLLSTKDLCTIDHIQELIEVGVSSFKIEGRMKRPEYVYAITRAYREVIDHATKRSFTVDELKQIFNREYTEGYMFYEKIMTSTDYSGNKGLPCAKVLSYDFKYHRLLLKAETDIHQNDGIRFGHYDEGKILNKIYLKGKLVNHVSTGTTFEIDAQKRYPKGTVLFKTTDYVLEDRIHHLWLKPYRKFPITMIFEAKVGDKAYLTVSDGTFIITKASSDLMAIANKPADTSRLQAQLSKVGNTIYTVDDISLHVSSDCFVPITLINQLRRDALLSLDQLRMHRIKRSRPNINFEMKLNEVKPENPTDYYHFHTKDQYLSAKPFMKENDIYFIDLCDDFKELHRHDPRLGLVVPSIINDGLVQTIQDLIRVYPKLHLALSNQNSYEAFKHHAALLLSGFNIYNTLSANLYSIPCVASLELTPQEFAYIKQRASHLVQFTYGHVDNMITKYCPLSYSLYHKKIEGCHQCLKGPAYLVDRAKAKFPLLFDPLCVTRILSQKPLNRIPSSLNYIRFTCEDGIDVVAYFNR